MKIASLAAGISSIFLADCDGSNNQSKRTTGLLTQTSAKALPRGLPASTVPMGLGVNAQFSASDTNTLAAAIDGVGFRFARLDLLWNLVEQVKGQYDFSLYEFIISTLAARGIRPLCILDYNNPLYDTTHSPPFTEVGPHTDLARQAFARFAAVAAATFKSNGVVWEIWNEPDNSRFWYPKPDPDGYMNLAKAAVNAMHQADPDATIVGPALVGLEPKHPDAWKFLERCFALGLAELVDAISLHSYRLGPPESVTADYLRVRTLLARYAPPEKTNLPIICSEWGYSLTWVSAQQQAEYFARLYLINLMNNLPLTIWYNWHDGPGPKQIEDNFGLVTFTDQPKMVYFAARTLTRELTNFRLAERVSLPSTADYALLFMNGAASKHVVWTTDNPHTVTLPLSGTSVMVTKLTGEKQALPIKNGRLTLELSSSPQYLDT